MEPLISIVDDDQAVRDALKRMLEAHGFVAVAFASAEQFLGWSKAHSAACLILDIRMPGMTGLALHDYLIGAGCRIPTILITALPSDDERRRAIASGAASYLAKPVSEQLLLDTIGEVLDNGGRAESGASSPRPETHFEV
jgi:FixJ family two-component response regulator